MKTIIIITFIIIIIIIIIIITAITIIITFSQAISHMDHNLLSMALTK